MGGGGGQDYVLVYTGAHLCLLGGSGGIPPPLPPQEIAILGWHLMPTWSVTNIKHKCTKINQNDQNTSARS